MFNKFMAIIGKKMLKPVNDFAIEARVEKVLAQDKPTPAPWHPTTQKRLRDLRNGNFHWKGSSWSVSTDWDCLFFICAQKTRAWRQEKASKIQTLPRGSRMFM